MVQGEAKVIFSNKGGTVVRDYRQVEKASALQEDDDSEGDKQEIENLAVSLPAS